MAALHISSQYSFLYAATGGSYLGSAHEVADVLLQELVVVIEFVVFLAHCFYAVENSYERVLQCFSMPGFS